MREGEDEQSRQREHHAGRERVRLGASIGVVPDERLQDRCDELVRKRDQTDLGEAQLKLGLEQRIQRGQQGLQKIVEKVSDAQRDQDVKRGSGGQLSLLACAFRGARRA
jgi:hypothetical protein